MEEDLGSKATYEKIQASGLVIFSSTLIRSDESAFSIPKESAARKYWEAALATIKGAVPKIPTHDLMENSGSDLSILDKSPSPPTTIDYQKTAQDIFIFFNLTFLKIFWMLA